MAERQRHYVEYSSHTKLVRDARRAIEYRYPHLKIVKAGRIDPSNARIGFHVWTEPR